MYGLVVWGTMCPKSSQNSLYRLQTDCVKLVAKVQKTYDAEILYKNLWIIRLPVMVYLEQCKLGYKLSKKLLPKLLLSMFNIQGGEKKHDIQQEIKTHQIFKGTVT